MSARSRRRSIERTFALLLAAVMVALAWPILSGAQAEGQETAPTHAASAPTYVREEFGDGWASSDGCDTRNRVLARDLADVAYAHGSDCVVTSGVLTDPYTGTTVDFTRGRTTSSAVQIDHVLPLAEAWRAGAHAWTREQRIAFANDTMNLVAAAGAVNASKSDDSLAEFVDEVDEDFRCQYVTTYLQVAQRYQLALPAADTAAADAALEECS